MGLFKKLFNREPKPGKPRPVTDESFDQDVLASPIPVAVDFWSPRCPPCHVMGGLLNEIGPEYVDRVHIFKLNVEQNQQTAAKFQVMNIPTLILFRDGKIVDRIVGLLPLMPLKEKLDRLAK
jgi:thioredoxin